MTYSTWVILDPDMVKRRKKTKKKLFKYGALTMFGIVLTIAGIKHPVE